jgi:hypothetical protein
VVSVGIVEGVEVMVVSSGGGRAEGVVSRGTVEEEREGGITAAAMEEGGVDEVVSGREGEEAGERGEVEGVLAGVTEGAGVAEGVGVTGVVTCWMAKALGWMWAWRRVLSPKRRWMVPPVSWKLSCHKWGAPYMRRVESAWTRASESAVPWMSVR